VDRATAPAAVDYDPNCYLCPGNSRAGEARNPAYASTFVFDNDYAALRPDTPEFSIAQNGLLRAESERGICRVLCYSPNHSLTLARMSLPDIRGVVDAWTGQVEDLGAKSFIRSVQIFENRGDMMGSSNPHPHCQIWADERLPNEVVKEQAAQSDYLEERKSCLLCDIQRLEIDAGERMVCENETFVAVVPFWAVWPFEVLAISKAHVTGLDELDASAADGLADILKRISIRFDNLFESPFPYTMGIHQRPTDGTPHPEWHLHVHLYPPLLRSATVRKFMVGYELLAMPQRDISAETAAERLRAVSERHYLESDPLVSNQT
jgi:UDPglucose--hexose-1-phosphate uridylyltransferase